MGNIAPEVTLVTMTKEMVRSEHPFIEYVTQDFKAKIIDRYEPAYNLSMQQEIYRADVTVFRRHTPYGNEYTETRIALDQEAKGVVDMFLEVEKRKYMETIADISYLYELEKAKSCWDRFIDWSEEVLDKWRS